MMTLKCVWQGKRVLLQRLGGEYLYVHQRVAVVVYGACRNKAERSGRLGRWRVD
jgi:hypothetical protein